MMDPTMMNPTFNFISGQNQSIYLPNLPYGYEVWVVTKRMRYKRPQLCKMEFRIELLFQEQSQERVWATDQDPCTLF